VEGGSGWFLYRFNRRRVGCVVVFCCFLAFCSGFKQSVTQALKRECFFQHLLTVLKSSAGMVLFAICLVFLLGF